MQLSKSQINTAGFLGRMTLIEASEAGSGVIRKYKCTCDCTPGKVYEAPSAQKALAFVIKHCGHTTRVDHEKVQTAPPPAEAVTEISVTSSPF